MSLRRGWRDDMLLLRGFRNEHGRGRGWKSGVYRFVVDHTAKRVLYLLVIQRA